MVTGATPAVPFWASRLLLAGNKLPKVDRSPHAEHCQGSPVSVSEFPHHRHLAQVAVLQRQGVPLCILTKEAKQVQEPSPDRQLRQQHSP